MNENQSPQKVSDRDQKLEDLTREFLQTLGLNLDDPSLKDTPKRFSKYMLDFSVLNREEPPFTLFPCKSDGLIVIDNMRIRSMCAHHLAPFFGSCTIAYYPSKKMAGLSKFQRTLDYLAKAPTEQETLTKKIIDYLVTKLNPVGLMVILDCSHTCMIVRGVQVDGSTTMTMETQGLMKDRREVSNVLSLLRK